jgi:hypothetical protein
MHGENGGAGVARKRTGEQAEATALVPAQDPSSGKTWWTREEGRALVARVEKGDKQALPEFRAMLDAHPDVVRALATFKESTPRALIRSTARHQKDALILEETLVRRCAALQAELEGPDPTPLERLLCEHITNCWLTLFLLEAAVVQTEDGKPLTWKWQEHDQWLRDRAQARYLAACTTLARVRRLLRPQVAQVNIAEAGARQMNLATP